MQLAYLWSLRLGFSSKQARKIKKQGIESFLQNAYNAPYTDQIPNCLANTPKTLPELRKFRKQHREASPEEKRMNRKKEREVYFQLKDWWIDQIRHSDFPLREKMTCFWHNHFVSSWRKVKDNYWIYEHNMILRKNAFGNYKALTKQIVKSNAMLKYLDNNNNKNKKINENLSRELLELFALGIGHYSEEDIKNGAKALAGLNFGNHGRGVYRKKIENNETITFLGKTGRFKADDIVDIIFEQENTPYFITEKILKWFIYDEPDDDLVKYYGDYLKSVDFEIQPFFTKMVTEEYDKPNAGMKIKDPLVYILQTIEELHADEVSNTTVATFISRQGMDLFNQPNVKGWNGGTAWLTSQLFLQRNKIADALSNGRYREAHPMSRKKTGVQRIKVNLDWHKNNDNKQIIKELTDRTLFQVNDDLQSDMENILTYDFNPKNANAEKAVLRLFRYIAKTPEYQLI